MLQGPTLPESRQHHCVVMVENDLKLFLHGGTSDNHSATLDSFMYDMKMKQWTKVKKHLSVRRDSWEIDKEELRDIGERG